MLCMYMYTYPYVCIACMSYNSLIHGLTLIHMFAYTFIFAFNVVLNFHEIVQIGY